MTETFANGRVILHPGDCLEVLARLDDCSVDACVTDPPYHLTSIVKRFGGEGAAPAQFGTDGAYARASAGFMGKQWDGGDIAFRPELWAEVLRVLKPGGHLLSFGGTRTYHRMACAIEDAGFEIRDCIQWLYATGFPKSHSVTKGCGDAICSCEAISECDLRSVQHADVPAAVHADGERSKILLSGLSQQGASSAMLRSKSTEGGDGRAERSMEGRGDISETQGKLRQRQIREMPADASGNGEGGRLRDGAPAGDGAVDHAPTDAGGMRPSSGSQTAEQLAKQSGTVAMQPQPQERGAWPHCGRCGKPIVPDGYGTALKPATEMIVLARKPLSEPTIAANVLRWGTGAINVGACRIAAADAPEGRTRHGGGVPGNSTSYELPDSNGAMPSGRWPANCIHDGSDEVVGAFPDVRSSGGGGHSTGERGGAGQIWGSAGVGYDSSQEQYRDSGSAARFFYTAKADADDRLGSAHPTVKPVDLIQYLIRLITPPGGLVLDPFSGTGTTGEAAFREGMRAVLIEREPEYQDDIRRRMKLAMSGPDERAREAMKERMKDKPVDHGPLFAALDDYDADKDFAGSIQEGFKVIRERMANGGKGWEPKS